MTTPTGLGLTRGNEAAEPMSQPIGNHAAFAAKNDAQFSHFDQQPEPDWTGKVDLKRSAT